MKQLYAIMVMLLLAVGAYAQDGKNLYTKYSDSKGVSAVYISPAMFRMIGKIPEINIDTNDGNMDIAPLIRSFQGFYMLDVADAAVISAISKDVDEMIRKGRYEMLMEVKEDGENLRMYASGDEKTIESILFFCRDDEEVQFICVDGVMDRNEFENLISQSVK